MIGGVSSRARSIVALGVLAFFAASCAQSADVPSGSARDAGPVDTGVDRPVTGAGGSRAGGNGGVSAGSGGAAGAGGTSGAAGGSKGGLGGSGAGGATGSGGTNGCQVKLYLAAPLTPDTLVSGPDSRIRMTAELINRGNLMPTWTWTVALYASASLQAVRINVTKVSDLKEVDSSSREFVAKSTGRYLVTVDSGLLSCAATAIWNVNVAGARSYVFRVTPPASLGLGIPTQEVNRTLYPQRSCVGAARRPCIDQIDLASGDRFDISPRRDRPQALLPSYVRLSLFSSAVTVEGYTGDGPIDAFLLPNIGYDLLVIPDGAFAPTLLSVKNTSISSLSLLIDEGMMVAGTIQTADGAPLVGARAVLHFGARPSTVGTSDAAGNFSLLTRSGFHAAVIVPPASSGLPEAYVDAAPGIDIESSGVLNVTYGTFTRAPLSIVVMTSDGNQAVPGSRVRVELRNDLTSVATVTAGGVSQQAMGRLHLELTTDTDGAAVFPKLPVGTYSVWVVPPATMPEAAVTTTQVILPPEGYTDTVALSRHLNLSGTLLPKGATAGVRLIGRDVSGNVTSPVVSAIVGEQGGYTMSIDPERRYLLVAEPPPGSTLARTMFDKDSGFAEAPAPNWMVDTAVSVEGSVKAQDRGVEGAVVQIYCLVSGSVTCLAPTLPIAETVTRADGSYTVALPAPTGATTP